MQIPPFLDQFYHIGYRSLLAPTLLPLLLAILLHARIHAVRVAVQVVPLAIPNHHDARFQVIAMQVAILRSDVVKPHKMVEVGIIYGDPMLQWRAVLPEQPIQIYKIQAEVDLVLDYYRLLRLLALEDEGPHGRLRTGEGR